MALLDRLKQKLQGGERDPFETTTANAEEGLARLYSMEEVDPATVRRVGEEEKKEIPPDSKEEVLLHSFQPLAYEEQCEPFHQDEELDFGVGFREWIRPLFLEEPLEKLQLSSQAHKALQELGIFTLAHALEFGAQRGGVKRGLGQGHVDEMNQALNLYLKGKDSQRSYSLDMKTLLSSIWGTIDRMQLAAVLSFYGIPPFDALSHEETATLKHMSRSQQDVLLQQGQEAMQHTRCWERLRCALDDTFAAFIKPWMLRRGGIATAEQLEERLLSLCENPQEAEVLFSVLQATYFPQGNFWATGLLPCVGGLYAAEPSKVHQVALIHRLTDSYFYREKLRYPVSQLIHYMLRECAAHWVDFSETFLLDVLRSSSLYYLVRGASGELEICRT